MKTSYRVIVTYRGFDSDYDRTLERAVRKSSDASGFFLRTGERDIQWSTNTRTRAEALQKKLRAVTGKRKRVSILKDVD